MLYVVGEELILFNILIYIIIIFKLQFLTSFLKKIIFVPLIEK